MELKNELGHGSLYSQTISPVLGLISSTQMLALVIAAIWVVHAAGLGNIMKLDKSYFEFLPAKQYNNILVWIYSFVNNAFLAQAAIQIIMSSKSVEEGKKGIKYILIAFIPAIFLSALVGIGARVLYPTIKGIHAAPMVASGISSPVLSTIVVLGLYFTALGWGAPLVLSGGICLANEKNWAIVSSIAGMIVGMGWYVIKFPKFLFDAHPMFVGMIVSMSILLLGTLWEYRGKISINAADQRGKWGVLLTSVNIIALLISIVFFKPLHLVLHIFVPLVTIEYTLLFIGVLFMTVKAGQSQPVSLE